jgi:hypothetical protein
MRTSISVAGCVGLLFAVALVAADPPYVGRWKVNEDKTDYGPAFTFSRTDSGDLRFTQGDHSYIVRLDGKDYLHPLGGTVRWIRIDERTWETTFTQNGRVAGNAIFQLSNDGQTLTSRPKSGRGSTLVYRRTSGDRRGLAGAWSLKTASASIMQIGIADGYDVVVGGAGGGQCKARFDDRDYPIIGRDGKPLQWEACKVSKVGDRGFSFTAVINGKPVAFDTFTVSPDGRTLTQVGGEVGKAPSHTIVHDRQ